MAESLINRADVASLFDLQSQGVAAEAQQKAANAQPDTDDDVDVARKSAESKVQQKLQQQKKEAILGKDGSRETYQKDDGLQKKWAAASDGRMGNDAAAAAMGWSGSGKLQQKLTDANKRMFQEHFTADPQRGTNTANALQRLASGPEFSQAASGSQQVGMIQKALVDNPKMEQPIRELLQTRFMQSPKADPQAKSDFLRFGMQQAARTGGTTPPGVKVAGDMLGVLVRTNTIPLAQKAAMNMVQRGPDNTDGMRNVDNFVQSPAVAQMPTFARGVATTLLAKSDGSTPVKEGLEQVAQNPKFQAQNPDMQARMFATIGSGRAGELRAMTDKTLQALQSSNFPTRTLQVGKFLDKMSKKASSKGAGSVDVEGLMRSAKGSPFPPVPTLDPVEGLDDAQTHQARAKNRAKVIEYYQQVSQSYKGVGRRIDSAKYFEDVNQLPNLREAGSIDTTGQTPKDAEFINSKAQQAQEQYKELANNQKFRMRALKTTRISPQRRRMLERRARAQGAQPKYFTPGRNRVGGNNPASFPTSQGVDAMPQAGGLARTPMAKQRTMANAQFGTESGLDAASILSQVPSSLPVQERMTQAKKVMAKQWEAQMKSVMQQILGASDPSDMAVQQTEQAQAAQAGQRSQRPATTQGKTDGWGIQRSFERDLGGTQATPVRPVGASEAAEEAAPDYRNEKYSGRTLIKPPTQVRDPATLMNVSWKDTQRGEKALLRNLGWTQPMWDAKGEPGARWPQSMRTPFSRLGSTQREAVRQLGLTSDDWDRFVESVS